MPCGVGRIQQLCALHPPIRPSAHPLMSLLLSSGSPRCLLCRAIAGNSLSGSIPASWAQLTHLAAVTMQPGNPSMCTGVPEGAHFKLCQAGSFVCSEPTQGSSSQCSSLPPQPGSGGSFPVAAVVAPVGAAAVSAAVLAALLWRRQHACCRSQAPHLAPDLPTSQPGSHTAWVRSSESKDSCVQASGQARGHGGKDCRRQGEQ